MLYYLLMTCFTAVLRCGSWWERELQIITQDYSALHALLAPLHALLAADVLY